MSTSPRPRPSNIFGLEAEKARRNANKASAKERHAQVKAMAKQHEEQVVLQQHQKEAKEKAREKEKNEFIPMVKDVLSKSYKREVDADDLDTIYDKWENDTMYNKRLKSIVFEPGDYVAFKRYILAILEGWDERKKEHPQETLFAYLDTLICEDVKAAARDPEFKKKVGIIEEDEEEGHTPKPKKSWFGFGAKRKTRSRKTCSRKTRSRKN